jgi:hypothetical protein
MWPGCPEWGGRHHPPINAPDLEARVAARWEEYGVGIPISTTTAASC